MKKLITARTLCCALLSLLSWNSFAQLSLQGYTANNVVGATLNGGTYTSEISSGVAGNIPKGGGFTIYSGLVAANIKTGTISVDAQNASGTTLAERVEASLFKVTEEGSYDTLDVVTNTNGTFSFRPVFLGNYLYAVDADPKKYVATYYGDAFLWDEANVLEVSGDVATKLKMTAAPSERSTATGDGLVRGTIEEDLEDKEGRVLARRRAARRKCGLRRKTGGGRTEQDGYELVAYGETNDNGEFNYGFLPQGTYRFFVEYPGIPLDESSFVQFDIGESGVSDTEFVLAAVVTEKGIKVELVLGITNEFFTDFSVYPNPTADVVNIQYDKILSEKMTMELIDMNGVILMSKSLKKGKDGQVQVTMKNYQAGQYLLKFYDTQKNRSVLTFRVIKQ